LIAGILFGNDLILAARVRAQISQLEKYNTAFKTFQSKYNCLPGDCKEITNFGLGTVNGDGDGNLSGGPALVMDNREAVDAWVHLSNAGLIEGVYSGFLGIDIPGINSPPLKMPGSGLQFGAFPARANPLGGVWIVYHDRYLYNILPQAYHAWFLTATAAITTWVGVYTAPAMYGMDSKIDDGYPASGHMVAVSGSYTTDLQLVYKSSIAPDACINDSTSPWTYNLANPDAAAPTTTSLCAPAIQTGF
jgi:hypothetical protein